MAIATTGALTTTTAGADDLMPRLTLYIRTSTHYPYSHTYRHKQSKRKKIARITEPLYELIDEVFGLEERGLLRRQTLWVAKQIFKLSFDGKMNTYINQRR